MIAGQETRPPPAALEQAIRHRVAERTGRRIQGLEVEARDGSVRVRGRVTSFHLKQLAIQGIIDVIGSGVATHLQVEIQVSVRLAQSDPDVD